jgi:hypothetical protein
MCVILALGGEGRLRQEGFKFVLGYIERPCLTKKKKRQPNLLSTYPFILSGCLTMNFIVLH